jgi:hypothetical protein
MASGAPKRAMMPSPVNLSTNPSKRSTPSVRMAKKRDMIFEKASGSRLSANSIEPFTSEKRTVTCLSSPSVMGWKCAKSKRSRSGCTSEPACLTCLPSSSRSAQCSKCVAVWLRAVRARISASVSCS